MKTRFRDFQKQCAGLLSIWLAMAGTVAAASEPYYSIPLAAFEDFASARQKVQQIRNKGQVAFSKPVDAPGDYRYYRVYMGKFRARSDAVGLWEKLKAAGRVDDFEVHLVNTRIRPARPARAVLAKMTLEAAVFEPRVPLTAIDRFRDNGDGTITDRATRLMWRKNGRPADQIAAVTWRDAIQSTEQMHLGGHDNWRLPTLEEWASLINSKRQFPALIEPNPFKNMVTHMPYWSKTEFTYGVDYTCTAVCPLEAYTVMLYSGSIVHQKKADRAFIMAVRSMDEPVRENR